MRPSTQDRSIEEALGRPVDELHQLATAGRADPRLQRVMEQRAFLAVAEGQLIRIRDRVHQTTAPDNDLDHLDADALRMDLQWLSAAVEARKGLVDLLTRIVPTVPSPGPDRHRSHPEPPSGVPASARLGADARPARHP